jgi:hypothetical protein
MTYGYPDGNLSASPAGFVSVNKLILNLAKKSKYRVTLSGGDNVSAPVFQIQLTIFENFPYRSDGSRKAVLVLTDTGDLRRYLHVKSP